MTGRLKCKSTSEIILHKGEPAGITFVCGHEVGHTDKYCGSAIADSEPLATVRWNNPNWDGVNK